MGRVSLAIKGAAGCSVRTEPALSKQIRWHGIGWTDRPTEVGGLS
mgnify:CR=1 FL=1